MITKLCQFYTLLLFALLVAPITTAQPVDSLPQCDVYAADETGEIVPILCTA